MAKMQKSVTFTNAEINVADGLIYERNKDGDIIAGYPIMAVLNEWTDCINLSISIKQADDLELAQKSNTEPIADPDDKDGGGE